MVTKDHLKHEYPLLLFGLAALGITIERLLALNMDIAFAFAAALMLLASAVVTLAIVHYWRFHTK